ncbi:hypothetical protein AB0E01_22915 [Nocardia vinacea]|uniref:hypothetical protein n=1 Tax=Nocardia vinacea TaxID=96468 RepID=UPI0033C1F077
MANRSEVREQFYQDMFDTAPRAVAYWARTEWRDDELIVREFGDDDEQVSEHVISVQSIATGWRRLLDLEKAGKWWHCQDNSKPIAKAERSLVARDGGEDADDCVADAVVQLATLGEVRYS